MGRYQLVRRIGSGGMAEIWKAKVSGPAGFEKVLAIKRILPQHTQDEDFVEMFIEEAKLAAQLHHPNIVQVFDFGMTDNRDYFIAMEYVAGPNLSALLKRLQRAVVTLPTDVALYIAQEVCKGLGHAHEATDSLGQPLGLIHRDISPQNLLVSYGGAVKITDFGIAKVAQASSRTSEGHVRGKLSYMSPEQARLSPLDPRSDLFSLGLVLYELMTGEVFFKGATAQEIYAAVMQFKGITGPQLAKLPPSVRDTLQTALQLDPEDRFTTATQMEIAVNGVLGPNGSVQARNTLGSFVRRHFVDEYQQEAGSEDTNLGTVTKLSESSAVRRAPSGPGETVVVDSGRQPVPPPQVSGETSLVTTPPKRRRGPWAVLTLVFVAFLAVSALLLRDRFFPGPSATPTATAVGGGSVTPAASATPRPTAPPTRVVVATPTVRKTPTPRPTPPPVARGVLVVKARPWANVWIDGRKVSRAAPLGQYRLTAGQHTVRFQNPALHTDFQKTVRVSGGRQLSISVNMSSKEVRVD